MRKLLILFFLGGEILLLKAQVASGFPFYKGPFEEMKIDAVAMEKPMVLFFYTDWCAACGEMLKKTLQDPLLKKYVSQEYLAFKVDAESREPDGLELAREYGVLFFPTIIYLNAFGQELKRESGYQSASHLLGELKRYRFVKLPPQKSSSPTSAVSGRSISTKEPAPPLPLRPLPANAGSPPSGTGFYQLSVRKVTATGYGAQIGVFSEYEKLLNTALVLENHFPGQVLVYVNASGEYPVFKLILGPYGSRVAAQDTADRSKQHTGKPGFVIELEGVK